MASADLELLEGWRAGDARAGEQLFARHHDALSGFFARRVAEAARDLVQETWLECLKSQQNFRAEASFRTFLFAIAHNVLRYHLRQRGGQADDLPISSIANSEPSPASLVHRRFELATLQRALGELSEEHRIILQLSYEEQLTSEQVGELLELPGPTVRTRIRRAKELLREGISQSSHLDPSLRTSTLETFDLWAREPEASE